MPRGMRELRVPPLNHESTAMSALSISVRSASRLGRLEETLFDRDALGQVAGFVYIAAPSHGNVVRQQLKGQNGQ